MANLGKVILVLCVYGLLFMAFGSLTVRPEKDMQVSLSKTLLFGFFLYHVVFQVVAIPFMFAQKPLSLLTKVWAVIAGVITVYAVIRYARQWFVTAVVRLKGLFGQSLWDWIPLLVMGISVIAASLIYVSFWDATYYVGQVSFSVYTDTINLVDPLSGDFLSVFDLKHCLATYHVNDAVICQLFGIHPLIETKTVMVMVIMALTNLLYYQIGCLLFHSDKKAVAIFMLFFLALNFCTYSSYTASSFLMFRTYEGKAITANLSIPAIIYLFLRLYGDKKESENALEKQIWRQMLLVSWGAVAIASSAMFLVPTILAAGALPYSIIRKQPAFLGKVFLAMLPCITVIGCYLLGRLGILEIAIRL